MKVFVYFNLHRKCWSVKALEGERKGRVIRHAQELTLRDVTFKVSEAGRQRVIREQRKNVHAGAVGTLCDPVPRDNWERVSYNPYMSGAFYYCDKQDVSVYNADFAVLADRKVWISCDH